MLKLWESRIENSPGCLRVIIVGDSEGNKKVPIELVGISYLYSFPNSRHACFKVESSDLILDFFLSKKGISEYTFYAVDILSRKSLFDVPVKKLFSGLYKELLAEQNVKYHCMLKAALDKRHDCHRGQVRYADVQRV